MKEKKSGQPYQIFGIITGIRFIGVIFGRQVISITRVDDHVISPLFIYWADLEKWTKFNCLFILQIKMCLQQLFKIVSYGIFISRHLSMCVN